MGAQLQSWYSLCECCQRCAVALQQEQTTPAQSSVEPLNRRMQTACSIERDGVLDPHGGHVSISGRIVRVRVHSVVWTRRRRVGAWAIWVILVGGVALLGVVLSQLCSLLRGLWDPVVPNISLASPQKLCLVRALIVSRNEPAMHDDS